MMMEERRGQNVMEPACPQCCLYNSLMLLLMCSFHLDNKGDQPIQSLGIDVIFMRAQISRGYTNISRD
uniref:Uncharacterized protein n=1 Tax=Daphnia magna TaxID=35525 RepID=A0A0P6JR18_9CRUS